MEDTYKLFKQAIDGKKEKVDYYVINPFTKILSDKIAQGQVPLAEGRKYTMLLLEAIEYGNSSGKNKEAWEIINAYAPPRLENLEGMEGLFDCQHFKDKYMAQFRAANTDCEVINRAYGRLLYGGCDVNSPEVQELGAAKKQNCYTPPPPEGPLKKAYNAYTIGQYKEAVRLFAEFIESTDDPNKKFKYSMLIAKIYYGDIKDFIKSRQYARQASSLNSASGEPYLLIGKLYASSGPLCGPGTGFDSQVITWPSIDMFQKAAKDSETKADADKLLRTYRQYMPSREDLFLRGLKEGDTYKVGCWIQESTKVRAAK